MTRRRGWAIWGVLLGCCALASSGAAQEPVLPSPDELRQVLLGNDTPGLAPEAYPDPDAIPTDAVAEPAPPAPHGFAIGAVWSGSAGSLSDRVARTRRAALEEGVWNLDAAARALIADKSLGTELERAQAAVALAPDLPLAGMALARALWLTGESPIAAVRAAGKALLAVPRHFEASLWFAGSALYVLAISMFAGALLCIAVAAAAAVPHATHDLGDRVSADMPDFARAALLAALLLVPAAAGLGWLGWGVALFAVGMMYGDGRRRVALVLAGVALVAAIHPVARLAGATITAYAADPVLASAVSATEGFPTPVDRARLEAAAPDDAIARQALAAIRRREGSLGSADAIYQSMLEENDHTQSLLNNAGSVRLALGHLESAMSHYRDAASLGESAAVLFNLSRVYGRAFQVEDLNRTLEAAQVAGDDVVAELTHLQGSEQKDFTVDLPLDRGQLWARVLASPAGDAFASELRSSLAPGWLGRDWQTTAACLAVVAVVATLVGMRGRPSRWCTRCGRRLCDRCDPEFGKGEICEGCTRLFHQPETTDRALRLARIEALRRRDQRLDRLRLIASLLVPGSAGWIARWPLTGLIGAIAAGLGVAAAVWHGGVTPDPLVVGAAAPLGFGVIAGVAGLVYALTVAASVAGRRL